MTTTCKTFQHKLKPNAAQEHQMFRTLNRCHEVYNAVLQERRDVWRMQRVSLTYYDQAAELSGVKEVRPEYQNIHSQVLQETLKRLEKAMHAFLRRVKAGEMPGYPLFQGANRFSSFTYPQYHHDTSTDDSVLVLNKIGRVNDLWSCPLKGTPKTVTIAHQADGWYVSFSCVDVPLPTTGTTGGIGMGLHT